MNGDKANKSSICNDAAWGSLGMNDVSPLEMGIKGGGRGDIDCQNRRNWQKWHLKSVRGNDFVMD